jgi:hypothetical protein
MKSNWISVKDRLPKRGARVIVGEAGCVESWEAIHTGRGIWYWNGFCMIEEFCITVTHWQPMPSPKRLARPDAMSPKAPKGKAKK